MWCRRIFRLAGLVCIVALAATLVLPASAQRRRGRKYKAPAPATTFKVTVLRHDDNKPIENASVIFHLLGDKGNMELKSNEDGECVIDVLPTGSHVLVQVIAHGYQTYGGDYMLNKPTKSIVIRLNRPGKQYSIYDNHDQASNGSQNGEKGKSSDSAAKDEGKSGSADKSENKDKSSGSAKPNGSQTGSGESQQP